MIDIHLYGKLRQLSENQNATSASVVSMEWQDGETVSSVVDRLKVPIEQLGSNVFLNGRYANLESPIRDGDRLGLFPDDMQLLYKWYFAPQNTAGASSQGSRAPNQDSAAQSSEGAKPRMEDVDDDNEVEK